jgi:hypothetical protein
VTDSAQYREGTVKSTPARGVKQILKPSAYVQLKGQGRKPGLTACLLEYDPASYPWWPVKPVIGGATAKASVNSASVSPGVDPKPLELSMVRLKRP